MTSGRVPLRQYADVVEAAPTAIIVTDGEGRIRLFNRQAERCLGWPREDILGEPLELLLPERYRASHVDQRDTFLSAPVSRPMGAGRLLHAQRRDGSEFPVEIGLNPIDTADGPMVMATLVDITAKSHEERKFRMAVEAAPNGMIMVDQQGRITMVNSRVETDFGYTADELIGQPVEILIPARFHQRHHGDRATYLGDPISRPMGTGRDLFAVRKDGSEFPVEVGLNPIHTPAGIEVLAIVVDISERKRLEEQQKKLEQQIQHGQKLESLGVLAGGIAHDFNNLLTGILGNADLALMELSRLSPVLPYLENIQKSAIRAADLCRQMLAYSGKGKFLVQALDLNRLIDEMIHLLRVSMPKGVAFHHHPHPKLPAIDGDATQINQVVMNLITNAAEAIGEQEGAVTIRTGAMDCDLDYLTEFSDMAIPDDVLPGRYVFLEVSDSGCGMDAETRRRIFDPFFTTKFSGRGLGLAAVLGIIRSHKGVIRVYSEKDRGTTFKILFPMSDQVSLPIGEDPRTLEMVAGSPTVLVVDDEQTVRTVARTALESAGVTVLLAGDGREGLERFEAEREAISLVLLDLTMPVLGGEEVFRRIRRQAPDLPVILMSGYSEHELSSRFAGRGISAFLQKPLRPAQLLQHVREALGGAPATAPGAQ